MKGASSEPSVKWERLDLVLDPQLKQSIIKFVSQVAAELTKKGEKSSSKEIACEFQ
jgi:phenylpyruvate tautomerase PptA (4-oxalocrotonate tautomerase family)